MKMSDNHILEIIKATPLVSIDLIIRNPSGKVLLGKRVKTALQRITGLFLVEG
jgi:hypothetical protein